MTTATTATATTIFARNSNVNSSGNNIRHNINSEKNSNEHAKKIEKPTFVKQIFGKCWKIQPIG